MSTAEIELPFAGPAYDEGLDAPRLTEQIWRVYNTMLDARWRTLGEISALTGDPEASISAQLRHLRKPKFGSFIIHRRRRGAPTGGLWEYQLQPPWVSDGHEKPTASLGKKSGFLKGLMYAGALLAKADSLASAKAALRAELLKAALK